MDSRNILIFFMIFYYAYLVQSAPCKNDKEHPKAKVRAKCDASNYLKRYGYSRDSVAGLSEDTPRGRKKMKKAIRAFQRVNNLPVTGEIDSLTLGQMNKPRCGKSDEEVVLKVDPEALTTLRKKRYLASGRRWKVAEITYKITIYTNDLPREDQDEIFERAFNAWAVAGNVKFKKLTSGNAHIVIYFGTGTHQDVSSFDGPGGMLAHAYYPSLSGDGYNLYGDAHFDDDEYFTDKTTNGINLYHTAVHEIGHSLGLAHSSHRDAIMAPFYRSMDPSNPYPALHQDDIDGIVAIYGPPTFTTIPPITTSPPSTTTTRPPPVISCSTRIDAMASKTNEDDNIFVFQGSAVVETRVIDKRRSSKVSIDHISDIFPNAPSNLDAAFTAGGAKKGTFLCKGDQCWRYDENYSLMSGYPKTLLDDFGVDLGTETLQAVFVHSTIDFISGRLYWSYGSSGLLRGYPKSLTTHPIFRLFTGGIDASVNVPTHFGIVATRNTAYTWSRSRRGIRPRTLGTVSSYLLKC